MVNCLTECCLLVLLILAHPIWPVTSEYLFNCTDRVNQNTTCGHITANGCCPKGCVRNARGRCVQELCSLSWNGFLSRPVTMSCYFHWFLLLFAIGLALLMAVLILGNLAFEIRQCLRKRRLTRYRHFTNINGSSSFGSTQC